MTATQPRYKFNPMVSAPGNLLSTQGVYAPDTIINLENS